jgi:hypothetical protein
MVLYLDGVIIIKWLEFEPICMLKFWLLVYLEIVLQVYINKIPIHAI